MNEVGSEKGFTCNAARLLSVSPPLKDRYRTSLASYCDAADLR
jgi:hypothetical protein